MEVMTLRRMFQKTKKRKYVMKPGMALDKGGSKKDLRSM